MKRWDIDWDWETIKGNPEGEWVKWKEVEKMYGLVERLMSYPHHVYMVYIPDDILDGFKAILEEDNK